MKERELKVLKKQQRVFMQNELLNKFRAYHDRDKVDLSKMTQVEQVDSSSSEDDVHNRATEVLKATKEEGKDIEKRMRGPEIMKYGEDSAFYAYK